MNRNLQLTIPDLRHAVTEAIPKMEAEVTIRIKGGTIQDGEAVIIHVPRVDLKEVGHLKLDFFEDGDEYSLSNIDHYLELHLERARLMSPSPGEAVYTITEEKDQ